MGRTAEAVTYLAAAGILLLAGCGGERETIRSTSVENGTDARRYEVNFHPSDYDPEPESGAGSSKRGVPAQAGESDTLVVSGPPEYVSGFRVQVISTTNIDDAKAKKAEMEAAYPGEWFYMIFDLPAYKVRAGNFLQRYEAERFAQELEAAGHSGAWPVPDRVIKNPLPPPVPQPQ